MNNDSNKQLEYFENQKQLLELQIKLKENELKIQDREAKNLNSGNDQELFYIELQNKMKSKVAGVMLAIFIPYFGLLYSSINAFFVCLFFFVIISAFFFMEYPFIASFYLSVGWIVSIFCAISGITKYNNQIIKDYKRNRTKIKSVDEVFSQIIEHGQPSENEELPKMVIGGKEIILVGTAHVSRESVDLVERVILAEKPDTVCVELCQSRFQSIKKKDQWLEMDIMKVIKEKKTFLLLSNLMLASFQKRIGDKLGVKPGEEMLRALDVAEANGAQVCLVDRDITITLTRTWRSTGFWNKMKLLYQLLGSVFEVEEIEEKDIEAMKEADMLESLLAELGKTQPVLREILIDERDRYLAQKIKTAPGNKIVAVVGAGHVPGIRRYIEQDTDIAALETLPPKGKVGGVMKWLIPGAIVALIVYGFFHGGAGVGTDMVLWWVVITGVFSGIGAVAAFGHPLSILSAVLAAPLTTLHPLLAAGWVSGIVEAMVRKPKVRDMESLPQDILSVRGFWRNHVTRILLMVVFTNIGASIGTFVALPMMMKVLGE